MIRLRALAGTALVACFFAGLTSCANKKGDLGAELDSLPIAEADVPRQLNPGKVSADPAESVDLADPKSRSPQSVSINRDAKLSALSKNERIPEAAQGEVVALNDTPVVKPAASDSVPKVDEKKADAPKADAKVEAVKPEVKKEDSVPAAKVDTADALKTAQALLDKQAQNATPAAPTSVVAAPAPVVAAPIAKPVETVKVPDAIDNSKNVTQVADDDKDKGKTPPKPTEPPANEAEKEKAERRLKEAEALAGVDGQARKQEAETAYQAGLRLFNDWEYEKAKRLFERAVAIDPLHTQALEKLKTVKSLLSLDGGPSIRITEWTDKQRVELQERTITLAHLMEEGHTFEARGSEAALDQDNSGKNRSLSDRLRFLEQAQDRYRRVIEIVNWMPPSAEMPGLRRQADEALTRVRGKIDKAHEEIAYNNRMISQKQADAMKARDTELFKIRIQKMLESVRALYDMHEYVAAEQMALRVLINDPLNTEAEKWKSKARQAAHTQERSDFKELYRQEYRLDMLNNDEAQISTAPLIKYPDNWDTIAKRTDVSIGRKILEEPWKLEIRKRLQRKVSFEFVDTPLADAVEFLRHLANVTMIIDPKVLATAPPQINLRVTDMNLDLALEWILKLAELEYALQDSAIFISKPSTLQPPLEMKIYDVSDLTQSIQDFPGPEFQITVAGDKNAAGPAGTPFGGAPKTAPPTGAAIQEMIKTRIRPDMWDPATGASIEEKAGKLVVMQRPEIHKLIDQLLSNFRSTQKMMINIESRFLNIREAYLEQTGVEFQGLDPNVLFGDFGDLRRLGAPTGFLQPRVVGSGDATPPNIPFPGFVEGPNSYSNGLVQSTVGAIINHTINFFPNEPDTISAHDPTNTVRQGGLSAQVTILNNTQVQAFIRALAVRENSSTLIAPRLTVFNTQRANMFVARQQSYVSDYEISGDSYDPVIRQFLVGVVLDVKPIVSSDRRYVTLELRPTVTELTNFVTRQIDTFSVNSGAQVNVLVLLSFPIQFPELAIQRVRTTATVPDGGIMLIGGLYKNLKFNAENGVPFLSDLPVVGRLFRWNAVDNAKSNLAILVSPRIILFNEEEEKLLR